MRTALERCAQAARASRNFTTFAYQCGPGLWQHLGIELESFPDLSMPLDGRRGLLGCLQAIPGQGRAGPRTHAFHEGLMRGRPDSPRCREKVFLLEDQLKADH